MRSIGSQCWPGIEPYHGGDRWMAGMNFVASFGFSEDGNALGQPAPHPWELSGAVESILNSDELGLIY